MKNRTRTAWWSSALRLVLSVTLAFSTFPASSLAYTFEGELPSEQQTLELVPDATTDNTIPGAPDQQADGAGQAPNGTAAAETPSTNETPTVDNRAQDQASSLTTQADSPASETDSPSPDGALPVATDILQAMAVPEATDIDTMIERMTLEEKIAQMIIVASRTWDGQNTTNLAAADGLAEVLRKHQYGGVILYANNVQTATQTAQLVSDLQNNNMAAAISEGTKHVPYFMAVDEEGGVVVRFATGTRMTGSMAVGATGAQAANNALLTGQVLGEESAVLGFNVDFAPSVDVNSNPSNPIIGTRSFSDDPDAVGPLGAAFVEGLSSSNVIATLKHFPGHGDTATDTHIETATVNKTIDQLRACELVPFAALADSADMIMTAHVTLPLYDDEVTFADGTKGYYPATMSTKVINGLLRGELGYDGVVITDALEMGAMGTKALVPGEKGSSEYCANVAEKVINAGCDILLLPCDLTNANVGTFYDEYIEKIAAKVTAGTISQARIDQSVRRILELKSSYGIFDPTRTDVPVFHPSADAEDVVGSAEHHATERQIARQAVTLVKNDNNTLPISGFHGSVVLLGRVQGDNKTIAYVVRSLQEQGLIAQDAYVRNLAAGTTSGSPDSAMQVTIDYYAGGSEPHYTDELAAAIAQADTVVCMTASWGSGTLATTSPTHQGVVRAMTDTHAAGGRFVFMANNLPYDVARYQDADAALLTYMSSGFTGVDPATDGSYNANVIAGIEALFDAVQPTGTLPVMLPTLTENADGSVSFTSEALYPRGHGLTYPANAYAFVEGAGSVYEKGSATGLVFTNNVRFDKLVRVLVDGQALSADAYDASAGSTNITLKSAYVDTLPAGEHKLTAVYNYGEGELGVSTSFVVRASQQEPEGDDGDKKQDAQQDTKQDTKQTDTKTQNTKQAASTSTSSTKTTLVSTGDVRPPLGMGAVCGLALCVLGLFVRRKHTDR